MTQIKKITDKNGSDIYLRTHTKAVIDSDGNTAESRLQMMQDEINAAQLEVGAVTSDIAPTKDSVSYVTSGGLYNQLHVGDSDEEIDLSQFTEVNGWINTSSKWNTSYKGIFIPINAYERYRITGNATGAGAYCFLTSDVVGSNNSNVTTIATGAERTAISSGDIVELPETPIGAHYLWVGTTVSGEGDRKPQKVEIVAQNAKTLKQQVLDNEDSINGLESKLYGGYTIVDKTAITFKNNSSNFSAAYGFRILVAPVQGNYTLNLHINEGYTINSAATTGKKVLGIRVLRDSEGSVSTIFGYDYTKTEKGTDVENIVQSVFDESQLDYSLDFSLEQNDMLVVIDRLNGTGYYSIIIDQDGNGDLEKLKEIDELINIVGTPVVSAPQTFVPVSSFDMAHSVKIYAIPRDGIYNLRLHMDEGWTTTAIWDGTSTRENIFSFRITSADYASGGSTVEYRNYAHGAYTNSQGVYIYKFKDDLLWQREMTAGQCVYVITRLDGTGVVSVEPTDNLSERVEYLETNASVGIIDEGTSIDDVATNKLDGEIAMIPKSLAANTYTNMIMCFFSDIHGDVRNIQRVLDFCDHYNISCIVHGGDSVADYYGDGTPFTSETGALVMNVIGNHDSTNSSSNAYSNNVSDANLYNTFITPFAESVVLPTDAATNGLCYWYKDYTSQGIRIIGINCMRWDSTQSTWLTNTLEDARTNDLSVIIVSHYPADDINGFDTGFNSRQWGPAYKGRTLYQFDTGVLGLVDSFITAGGEFICYLTGHQHRDHVGTCVHATNTQIQLTIDSSSTDRHANAIYGTTMGKYSIDFDIIGIDLYQKCIKVVRVGRNKDGWMREFKTMCIDYINGNLYNRYKIE